MRGVISILRSTTDTERSSQHPIHPGMRRQGGAPGLEPLPELGFQVPGYRDHDRRRLKMRQIVDQLELLLWSQRGLQHDYLAHVPGAGSGVGGTDPLDRNSKPGGRRPSALGEQKVVLDDEERSSHGCRIAG
jgi:hypothetical protein